MSLELTGVKFSFLSFTKYHGMTGLKVDKDNSLPRKTKMGPVSLRSQKEPRKNVASSKKMEVLQADSSILVCSCWGRCQLPELKSQQLSIGKG